ncbi:phosphatidylinositol-specific phospholipase C/glycerophosphodiester phosphodiesterase family protein [Maioricimonas sp. JC845]|uniref:phosphatidylinositol-specific phospholipase C/glycerophosphodiester phosphodiesterase family protein n=1 Tax=Maioricimonas sp. JC845 TaxID=3232138 RepID=UPI0034585FD9
MRVELFTVLTLLTPILLAASAPRQEATPKPLPAAHAHNDYRHPRPLLDALDHGFCSVEADIFLVDGQLLVGHDREELRPERTLQRLYLDPLRHRVQANGGRVYENGPTVTLLIDIKEDGEATWAVLNRVLASYRSMLARVENGEYHPGAVQVVISGDRPKEAIAAESIRYAGIDGRLSDLDSTLPAHLLPLISDRWTSHFRWSGEGEFPAEERGKLQSIVEQAHAAGRRVRFWATPEKPAVWRELSAAGVDHINTDRLAELEAFLRESR